MADTKATAEFKQGVDLLQNGNPAGAIGYLRNALEAEERNPYFLSFLGLAVARAQKKWLAATLLCEAAVHFGPDEPQFYLNLAEVYAAGNRGKEALRILASARKRFLLNSRTKREKGVLPRPRGQLVPFLIRPRFLKRTLEQLRCRVMNPLHKPEEA